MFIDYSHFEKQTWEQNWPFQLSVCKKVNTHFPPKHLIKTEIWKNYKYLF